MCSKFSSAEYTEQQKKVIEWAKSLAEVTSSNCHHRHRHQMDSPKTPCGDYMSPKVTVNIGDTPCSPVQLSSEEIEKDDCRLICLLNSQEKAILYQLCAHQLNRLVELTPVALNSLITCANGSEKQNKQSKLTPYSSSSSGAFNAAQCSSPSFTDRAKSALFTWGGAKNVINCGPDVSADDITIVKVLSYHLSQNLDLEGLFRVPGNLLRVDKLKEGIKNGEIVNLLRTGYFTQHDVASVLKSYLSGLDIIPNNTHLSHLIVANLTHSLDHERSVLKEHRRKISASTVECSQHTLSVNEFEPSNSSTPESTHHQNHRPKSSYIDYDLLDSIDRLIDGRETFSLFEKKKKQHIEALQIMFCMLTYNQRAVLKIVLQLLYKVAKKKNVTKMDASNLATLFAPHFFSTTIPNVSQKLSNATSGLTASAAAAASVNLNISCVENWSLTCYAVTFMIRHCHKVLLVPSELRDQVANYLYARENAPLIMTPNAVSLMKDNGGDGAEKRGRFKFKKQTSYDTTSLVTSSNIKIRNPSGNNDSSHHKGAKQRSKSVNSGLAAIRNRLPGINGDKKESYVVSDAKPPPHRHLSPPKLRKPLTVSPIQNNRQVFHFKNTAV